MRICSLLPSATEILFGVGAGDQVIGVTHECDFPPEVRSIPVVTRCVFDSDRMTQEEIDSEVRRLAHEQKSLYQIDDALFYKAAPDLIVTQDLCHVCAITPDEVARAVSHLSKTPRVVTLNPKVIDDVLVDLLTVAQAAGLDARRVIETLRYRGEKIATICTTTQRQPRVGCIEWLDPLWRTGHWVPGMVQLAGGNEVFAEIGQPSRPLTWEELQAKDPEILILMPCGLDLHRTQQQFEAVRHKYGWENLRAFRNKSTYLVDANSYFSRSGPRLFDGLEILAELLHPESCSKIAPPHSYIRIE